VAVGVIASAVLTRYVEALLFGITPLDPVTFIAALIVLILVAALATLVPASRAASIDPASALRCE
jgi:ABC-type lipoprotein release transport system permease subunit